MSLLINTNQVTRVLLADGWHEVLYRSFDLDAYEIVEMADDGEIILAHGQVNKMCNTGFAFNGERGRVSGPITSIIAICEDKSLPKGRP